MMSGSHEQCKGKEWKLFSFSCVCIYAAENANLSGNSSQSLHLCWHLYFSCERFVKCNYCVDLFCCVTFPISDHVLFIILIRIQSLYFYLCFHTITSSLWNIIFPIRVAFINLQNNFYKKIVVRDWS